MTYYWDGHQWVPHRQGMTTFQHAVLALLTLVIVLAVMFVVVQNEAPCLVTISASDRVLCEMAEEFE